MNSPQSTIDCVLAIEEMNCSPRYILESWAYLIRTGQCWSLQGFYGRTARNLIDNNSIDTNGNITDYGYSLIEEENENEDEKV